MPTHFLLLRVVLFVTCACSVFLGTSGACWIVGCNGIALWCRIRVQVQTTVYKCSTLVDIILIDLADHTYTHLD